jgi:hypothetical protein
MASWVLLEDSRTNRRHVAQHRAFLRTAFPADGRSTAAWLRRPSGPIRCLSFLPIVQPTKRGRGAAPGLIVPTRGLILPVSVTDERLAEIEPPEPALVSTDERLAGFYRG